jgi:hypothetical protein
VVKDIIESEYQKPLSDIFKSIESTPIGEHSIDFCFARSVYLKEQHIDSQ